MASDPDAVWLNLIQQLLGKWKAKFPREYQAWLREMERERQRLQRNGVWSQSKELLYGVKFPQWVDYQTARCLQLLHGWPSEKAKEWRTREDGRPSRLALRVYRDLLPQCKPYSKEQVKMFHQGVDLKAQ